MISTWYSTLLRFKTVLVLAIPLSLATVADPLQKYCVRYASDDGQCPQKCSRTQSLCYCADVLLQNSYRQFGVSGTTTPFALSLIQPSEVMTISSLNCSVKLQLHFSIQQQICYLRLLTIRLHREACFKMYFNISHVYNVASKLYPSVLQYHAIVQCCCHDSKCTFVVDKPQ